jgi:hypothetical protein
MPAERLLPLRTSPKLASEGNNASVPTFSKELSVDRRVMRGVPKHQLRMPLMKRRTVRNRCAHETGDELFSMKTICPHPLRVGKFFYVKIISTLPQFRVCSIRVKQLSTQSLPAIAGTISKLTTN